MGGFNVSDEAGAALVIGVTYGQDEHLPRFLKQCQTCPSSIEVAIVDNSPAQLSVWSSLGSELTESVTYRAYEDNPGYIGGAQRLLLDLAEAGRLRFKAIVLANTDVRFECVDLKAWLDRLNSDHPDRRWVAAPDLREDSGRTRMNPHIKQATQATEVPPAVRRAIRVLAMPYPIAATYRALASSKRWLRRTIGQTSETKVEIDPPKARVFAPHGAFMAFGAGLFEAGADFSGLPLFNEELAVGAIASALDVPVYYDPSLRVDHVGRATTGSIFSIRRHRLTRPSAQFYRDWVVPQPSTRLSASFAHGSDE